MRGTVASVAKKALKAGETLDGEGGYTVWGKALPIATASTALPIGLAHGVKLTRDVPEGEVIMMNDVDLGDDPTVDIYRQALATCKI